MQLCPFVVSIPCVCSNCANFLFLGIVFTLMTVRLAMSTSPVLMTTRRDQTTINFATRTTGTGTSRTEQSKSINTAQTETPMHALDVADVADPDDWELEREGKYGVPLEDMFTTRDLVEKRGSMEMFEGRETHNV